MTAKTLEQWIALLGEEKGKVKYDIVCRTNASKAETYKKHPYKRLTKEWFMWRYGDEEGLLRFNKHVAGSVQTLENFIKRHGEVKGKQMYEETMRKKNTWNRQLFEDKGLTTDEIDELFETRRETSGKAISEAFSKISPKIRADIGIKRNNTKLERYGTASSIGIIRSKFGVGSAEERTYLKKLFPTVPGRATKQSLKVIQRILREFSQYSEECLYGFGEKKELKLYDSKHSVGYSYDCTIPSLKLIVEYDGASFHATQKQATETPNKIMPAMIKAGITYLASYQKDTAKLAFARQLGYTVFVVRSDDIENSLENVMNYMRKIC